jgi:hypothetical protein
MGLTGKPFSRFQSRLLGVRDETGSGKSLCTKGTALQAAEELIYLKGTAFRPYITTLK